MRERRVLLPERLHLAADLPHGHAEMVALALEVVPLRLGARGRGQSPQLTLDMCGRSLGVERVHLPHVTQPNPVHVGSPTPRMYLRGEAIRFLGSSADRADLGDGGRAGEGHRDELRSGRGVEDGEVVAQGEVQAESVYGESQTGQVAAHRPPMRDLKRRRVDRVQDRALTAGPYEQRPV